MHGFVAKGERRDTMNLKRQESKSWGRLDTWVLPSHFSEYWTSARETLPVLKAESPKPAGSPWLNALIPYYLRPFSANHRSRGLILKPLPNIVGTPFLSAWKTKSRHKYNRDTYRIKQTVNHGILITWRLKNKGPRAILLVSISVSRC